MLLAMVTKMANDFGGESLMTAWHGNGVDDNGDSGQYCWIMLWPNGGPAAVLQVWCRRCLVGKGGSLSANAGDALLALRRS